MSDSRLPLTIRTVAGGYAVAFADGRQQIYIVPYQPVSAPQGREPDDEALELAKEVVRALMAAWGNPWHSAA